MEEKRSMLCAHTSASHASPGRNRICRRGNVQAHADPRNSARGVTSSAARKLSQRFIEAEFTAEPRADRQSASANRLGRAGMHRSEEKRGPEDGGGPSSGPGVVTVHFWFGCLPFASVYTEIRSECNKDFSARHLRASSFA